MKTELFSEHETPFNTDEEYEQLEAREQHGAQGCAYLPPKTELFNEMPFNLAGEALDESVTPEGEARVRALAANEARKAQTAFNWDAPEHWKGVTIGLCARCGHGHVLRDTLCWNCSSD